MAKEIVAIIGGGSGLGNCIANYELSKNKKVIVFTSKKFKSKSKQLLIYQTDLNNYDEQLFINVFKKFNIKKVYYCSVSTSFQKLSEKTNDDVRSEIEFNLTSSILFIKFLLNHNKKINLIFILSHICFLYNPGFSIYRMTKIAVNDLLNSLEFENPEFKVFRVFPGAIDTNFVKNSGYKGKSFLKKRSPDFWAKKIVNSNSKIIINKFDYLISILDVLIPFRIKKKIYQFILNL